SLTSGVLRRVLSRRFPPLPPRPLIGFSRTLDEAMVGLSPRIRFWLSDSSRPKEPLSQQIEVRPAVHLPLQRLESIYLALHRAIAPRQSERCLHGHFILP